MTAGAAAVRLIGRHIHVRAARIVLLGAEMWRAASAPIDGLRPSRRTREPNSHGASSGFQQWRRTRRGLVLWPLRRGLHGTLSAHMQQVSCDSVCPNINVSAERDFAAYPLERRAGSSFLGAMRIGDWIADWHLAIAQWPMPIAITDWLWHCQLKICQSNIRLQSHARQAVDISRKLYTFLDGAGGA